MICNLYRATLRHDTGKTTVSITASSAENAFELICKAENCPVSAIVKLELVKCIYNIEVK
jgi:hypothetical protein